MRIFFIIFLWVSVSSGQVPWFDGDVDAAAADAEQSGRLLCLVFVKDKCGYCHQLISEVMPDPAMVEELESMVNLKIAFDSEAGQALAADLEVPGTPTMLILSPEMREVDRIIGVNQPAKLAEIIRDYRNDRNTFGDLRRRLQEDPGNSELIFELARKHADRQKFNEAFALFNQILRDDPDNSLGWNDDAIYHQGAHLQLNMARPQDALKILTQGLERYPKEDKAPVIFYRLALCYRDLNDPESLAAAYVKYAPQLPINAMPHRATARLITQLRSTSADLLHVAWQAAEKALEIESGNHKNHRVAAGVLLLIDDFDGAKSAIKKAIELAPTVSEYQDMHTFIVNGQRGN
jgi:TolA-binding protein